MDLAQPLRRLRVVDLTDGEAGSLCTMHLGLLGADVIKVEPLEGGSLRSQGPPFVGGVSAHFWGLNYNKRSLALDLRSREAHEILLELCRRADIVVESFRPGVAESLGADYPTVLKANPAVVYGSLSSFGQAGPYSRRPATELEMQGMTGLLRFQGRPDQAPVRVGANYASATAGLYLFVGLMAAIFHRARTGEGQKVETSVLAAMVATQNQYILSDNATEVSERDATFAVAHKRAPARGYKTRDLPVHFTFWRDPEGSWRKFCSLVGLGWLTERPEYQTLKQREEQANELRAIYEEVFADKPAREVIGLLEECDAVCSVEHTYETLVNDPQVLRNEMILDMDLRDGGKTKVLGVPWKLSKTPGANRLFPPVLGEHTREILMELGRTGQEIDRLCAQKVCAEAPAQ